MMRKTSILVIALILAALMLAACGREEEPTPAPEPTPTEAAQAPAAEEGAAAEEAAPAEEEAAPAEEAATTEEEAPAAEEAAAGEAVTETAEAAPAAEEAAAGEAVTETAEAAPAAEEAAAGEAVTETAEVAPAAEEAAAGEAVTETAEVAPAEEVTATEPTTATEEVAPAEEMTTTEEVAPSEEVTATEETTATEEAAAPEAAAETAAGLTVESARSVTEILNDENAAITVLSPDGQYIAYVTYGGRGRNRVESACVFAFESATPTCYDRPEGYEGYPYNMVWSPDSTMIAFTENPYQLGYESDIWILDVASGTATNRTDDGVTGSWSAAEAGSYNLDYLPMWDQSTGDLLFWRTVPQGEYMTYTLVLMRMDPREGDAAEVHDFTTELAGLFFPFDYQNWFMNGPSYPSPDGTKIAMLPMPLDSMAELTTGGVWIADLTSDGEAARQVATVDDLQVAMPAWQEPEADPVAVQWTADSKGFVVLAISMNMQQPMLLFYYVDAESGALTPINDLSGVESYEAYMSQTNELGLPPRYYSPWTATVSPKGQQLMMIQDLGGVAAVLTAPLPPDGSAPAVAWNAETYSSQLATRGTVAEDGKVLIYAALLTTTEE